MFYFVFNEQLMQTLPSLRINFNVSRGELRFLTSNDHFIPKNLSAPPPELGLQCEVSTTEDLKKILHFIAQKVLYISRDAYELEIEGELTSTINFNQVKVRMSPSFLAFLPAGYVAPVASIHGKTYGTDQYLGCYIPPKSRVVKFTSISHNEQKIKYQYNSQTEIWSAKEKASIQASLSIEGQDVSGSVTVPFHYMPSAGAARRPPIRSSPDAAANRNRESKWYTLEKNIVNVAGQSHELLATTASRITSLWKARVGALGYDQSNSGETASFINKTSCLKTGYDLYYVDFGQGSNTASAQILIKSSSNALRLVTLLLNSLPMLQPEVDDFIDSDEYARCLMATVLPFSIDIAGYNGKSGISRLVLSYKGPDSQLRNMSVGSFLGTTALTWDALPYEYGNNSEFRENRRGIETSKGAYKVQYGDAVQQLPRDINTGNHNIRVTGAIIGDGTSSAARSSSNLLSFQTPFGILGQEAQDKYSTQSVVSNKPLHTGSVPMVELSIDHNNELSSNIVGAIL